MIGSYGGCGDIGSEFKCRKVYEFEKCVEEIMLIEYGLEMGFEIGDMGCEVDYDVIMSMEVNKYLLEF